jgi:hypothetical protein
MRILIFIFGFLCSVMVIIIGLYLLCSPVHAEYTGFYHPNKYNCGYDENCAEWNKDYLECLNEKEHPLISQNYNQIEAEEIYRNAYVQCMANHGHNLSN